MTVFIFGRVGKPEAQVAQENFSLVETGGGGNKLLSLQGMTYEYVFPSVEKKAGHFL